MIDSDLLPAIAGYIDGAWAGAHDRDAFPVVNPATLEVLAEVPAMGYEETNRAVAAAQRALDQPSTPDQRRGWLIALADSLGEHREELGRLVTLENGKPLDQGVAEADYAAGFFRFAAEHLHTLLSHPDPGRLGAHAWNVYLRPAGVAALITPWNFPIAMAAKKLSAALAADCPVVIKPSEITPLSMMALVALGERIGLPAGRLNLVVGAPERIGAVLCEHAAVRVISFTGSTRVGRHLIRATAASVKRLSLELGGNAPFVVFADADLDTAVDHLVGNKFRASGQTCVCANRVLVQRSVHAAFRDRLAARIRTLVTGNGMETGVHVGPLINRESLEKVERHLADALGRGAIEVTRGAPAPVDLPGHFMPPVLLDEVTGSMACAREETFGPLVPLMVFDGEEEALARCNETEHGLAAYLFTGDAARVDRLLPALRFGHVGVNSGTGPTPQAPFGGMKQSGYGREGGFEGIREFLELQTVARAGPSGS